MSARAIRSAIGETNGGLALRAVIALVMGTITCVVLAGFVVLIAWLLVGLKIALAIAGALLLVGFWSAWRRVDPLAGAGPMTQQQELLTSISLASPHFVYVSPRHALAGSAHVVVDGPANVLEAVSLWRARIRASGGVIDEAARLLGALGDGVPARVVSEPAGAALLCRVDFAKLREQDGELWLLPTEKGRDAAAGA